jgi:AcrR family transcriptional regulator
MAEISDNSTKRTDRRVMRTRRQLRAALLELISEQGYDAVTVQDITDRANLGRATFYIHYQDKHDLFAQSLTELFDQLAAPTDAPVLAVFQHISLHRELYRVVLHSGTLQDQLKVRLIEMCRAITLPNTLDTDIPLEVRLQHMAGSLLALLGWWLADGSGNTPEGMAEMYERLHNRPHT